MASFDRYIVNPGPKAIVSGASAACSSDNAIVTETILQTMAEGGNAIDAAVAGCMVQAAVEPFLTNHTGTISLLFYEASTGSFHQLHSAGTFPAGLAPFRPIPRMATGYARLPPAACIPGFMPGLGAMHARFGRSPWPRLVEPAIRWAEEGHPVSSFEYGVTISEQDFITYFPEGRAFYMPGGFYPAVGERFRNPSLAETLRGVARDGPDHMIRGAWASAFVAKANAMGWPITLAHMAENPPRWIDPLRLAHAGQEIVALGPPEQQGAFIAMVLGMLDALDLRSMTPGSAEALFSMAHALRLGLYFCGFLGDPIVARYDVAALLDGDFHRSLARLIAGMRPDHDLTEHLRLVAGPTTRGDGHGLAGRPSVKPEQPTGSCELSIVDAAGNWVQMMNTLQSGGIPGMVVGGVPMVGSHATFAGVSGHFDIKLVPGARLRTIVGNTFVLRDGAPAYALGTPGNVFCTIPQVLVNLLDWRMTPEAAIAAPRMLELGEDGALTIEDRIDADAIAGLARMGVPTGVLPPWDWHMGSFQMCYRDAQTGRLGAVADPRRTGVAGGLP
ncbi:gamma-glutamyltransferase family protein [Sphingomonas nostoxanthinifaciens]|uniref:gamma-glutamyltransferase family protein n=1 Tax=Sphingomonas nostoxanthinifaciens TaxID=2872652 RepID=UPI001CC21BDB|nr:gamma-glutamyltransferase [Sphingomonas nostoxanthinifaciens]UAK23774.1 gamma-glutamyltransferase [Sphingomonas nostoxanthinifaciens]